MVIASAIFFGAMPIFAKLAYNGGTDAVGLLMARFLASGLILVSALRLSRGHFPDPKKRGLPLLVLLALFSSQSFCYFASVEQNGAVTATLLLYTYPLLTTVVSTMFFAESFGFLKGCALVTGFIGVAFSINGFSASFSSVGLLTGIGSSVLFTATMLLAKRILGKHGDASEMMALLYVGSAPLFLLAFFASGASLPDALGGWAALAGVVLLGTVAAMGLFFAGLDRLPAGTAGMLSSLEPAIAVVLAAIFLAEPIALIQAVGVVLVVGSILMLTRLDPEDEKVGPAPSDPV